MSGSKILATEQYLERTGTICPAQELAHIVSLASLPPSPGEVPSTEVIVAITAAAKRSGLPGLKEGHYGLDLASGEFLRSV